MFNRLPLTMLIAVFLAEPAIAQVQIDSVDLPIENGTTITISGQSFGTKSTAAPLLWDDLSSSAYANLGNGDTIPTQSGSRGHPQDASAPWPNATVNGDYGNTKYFTSTSGIRVDGRPVYGCTGSKGSVSGISAAPSTLLFVDWWFYTSSMTAVGDKNYYKIARIWGEGGTNAQAFMSVDGGRTAYSDGGEDSSAYGTLVPSDNEWHHITFIVDSSRGISNNQGEFWTFLNNQRIHHVTDLGAQPEYPSFNGNFTMVERLGSEPNNTGAHSGQEQLWGDIYIDDTLARVVLGDSGSWSSVSHYEMQIPQDWQSDSIQVAGNLGSFSASESVWLYVIDADGNVNQSGFPVATVEGPPVERPGQPGQPALVQ